MIDEKTLARLERHAISNNRHDYAEAFRLARRYLVLRKEFAPFGMNISGKHSWCWRGSPSRMVGETIDAAADRLLEGGE